MSFDPILHGRFDKSEIETKLTEAGIYFHCKANFALRMGHHVNEFIKAKGLQDSGLTQNDFEMDGKNLEAFYGALRGEKRMLLVVFKTFCSPVNWRYRKNICYNLTYPSTPDVEKSPRHTQSDAWLANEEGADEKLQVWVEARAAEIIECLVDQGVNIPDDFEFDCECEFLDFIKPTESSGLWLGRLFGKSRKLNDNDPSLKVVENSKTIHFGAEWVSKMCKESHFKKEQEEREHERIEAEIRQQEVVETITRNVKPDSKDLPREY